MKYYELRPITVNLQKATMRNEYYIRTPRALYGVALPAVPKTYENNTLRCGFIYPMHTVSSAENGLINVRPMETPLSEHFELVNTHGAALCI